MSQLAQANGYTWASQSWLNIEGSYHRIIYEDRILLQNINTTKILLKKLYDEFKESNKSRIVARMLFKAATWDELQSHIISIQIVGWDVSYYKDNTWIWWANQVYYITYSRNKSERTIWKDLITKIRQINGAYIEKILTHIESKENFQLENLRRFQDKGYRLTGSIKASELATLWQPFWWSELACADLLSKSWDGDFVLGVRNEENALIASILYSHQPHTLEDGTIIQHGELTEATTIDTYRGNGIMWVLATALHVRAMQKGIMNIYGEYRATSSNAAKSIQSIRFALESGVRFTHGDILINHVDVNDVPDEHNREIHVPWYGIQETQLKNFLLWALDPHVIDSDTHDAYLNSIS